MNASDLRNPPRTSGRRPLRRACCKAFVERASTARSERSEESDIFPNESSRTAFMAFEDLGLLERMQGFVERFVRSCGDNCKFEFYLWEYTDLAFPSLRESAVQAALETDTILLVTHGNEAVPRGVKLWIEDWLARRARRPGELIVLFEPASARPARQTPTTQFAYFSELARVANLRLLTPTLNPAEYAVCRSATTAPPFPDLGSWQRWGINE
jgi:hypothetical protein